MKHLSDEEYKSLIKDRKWLQYLEDAGVDNWEGYDMAVDAARADGFFDDEVY